MTPEFIGYFATFLTALALIPQAVITIRTKRTGGTSILMYVIFFLGAVFWLIYGLLFQSLPIIAASIIASVPIAIILVISARTRYERLGTLKPRPPGVALPAPANPDLKFYIGHPNAISCEECGMDISPEARFCGFCRAPTDLHSRSE